MVMAFKYLPNQLLRANTRVIKLINKQKYISECIVTEQNIKKNVEQKKNNRRLFACPASSNNSC